MTRTELAKHHYAPSGVARWRGGPQDCAHCPLPAANAVHEVEEQPPPEVAEQEARRLGERIDDDAEGNSTTP
jgi:hypothetical protein